MAKKTYKNSPHLQILFRESWRQFNNGGQWLEYVEDNVGEDLLEPTKLEDIKPDKLYYMQQVTNKQHFHPTIFHPSVTWFSIQELHKTGRIWQLTQGKKDTATNSPSETGSEN